jgi:hypothetical protein
MKLSEAFAKRTYDRSLKPGSAGNVGEGEILLAQGVAAIALKDLEGTEHDDYHDVWLLANETYLSESVSRIRELLDEILRGHYGKGPFK